MLIVFPRIVLLSILSILKKTLMSDRFNKSFSFSIDSSLFKKSSEVFDILNLRELQFYVLTCPFKEK